MFVFLLVINFAVKYSFIIYPFLLQVTKRTIRRLQTASVQVASVGLWAPEGL